MIEENYEDLVHREIDGVATPEESARLREYLVRHPELGAVRKDLEKLSRMLGDAGDVDPPAELKHEILSAIQARQHAMPRSEGWWEALMLAFRQRLRPATALSFAAGAVVGVALLLMFGPGLRSLRMDDASLPGMILPIEKLESFNTIAKKLLEGDGVRLAVETRRSNGIVLADFDMHAVEPVEIQLEFDPAAFSPLGFEQTQGFAGNVLLSSAGARIAHQGETHYRMILKQDESRESELRMRVYSDSGRLLLEDSVAVSPGEHEEGGP